MRTSIAVAKLNAAIASGTSNHRVFDWNEAARRIVQSGAAVAGAGLQDDWEWTGGTIFVNGQPVFEPYTYLASLWAIPELEIDGNLEPCYTDAASSGWNADTVWPESAIQILKDGLPYPVEERK